MDLKNTQLLRFTTAGSVDDGKSTLIGRLLYDSKSIFQDQLEAVERSSQNKGFDYVDLSLLTDGLKSEREQGITIDVAYRYFAIVAMMHSLPTDMVLPQEHADKNKAPSPSAAGSKGQKQEGSRQPSHHVHNIFILVMNPFRSSSEGVPKQDPNPKRLRTESTLAENRVVLI